MMKNALEVFKTSRSVRLALVMLPAFVVLAASFQNCGRVSITAAKPALAPQLISTSVNVIKTTLNHTVTTPVNTGLPSGILAFDQYATQFEMDYDNGKATIVPGSQSITFTPKTGFRGTIPAVVYASYGGSINIQNLTFEVDNPTLTFKPAIAVRAPECVLCHASVQGDFVSDFGYKSSTETGPDLFLSVVDATDPWMSAYGIADFGENSLSTATIVGKLAIPKVDLTALNNSIQRSWYPLVTPVTSVTSPPPSPVTLSPPITTLADYIQKYQLPTNVGFAGVNEQSNLYIGAPSKSDILNVAGIAAPAKSNFFKNNAAAPDLSGLNRTQVAGKFDYFTNLPGVPLVCEGDVFVDGVVLLDHVQVQTTTGCRIYSTHSIFVQGTISYLNPEALSNVELSSAVGIFMGFGYCIDCLNAPAVGSTIADAANQGYGYAGQNTLSGRFFVIQSLGALASLRSDAFEELASQAMSDFALTSDAPTTMPPATTPATRAGLTAYYAQLGLTVTQFDGTNSAIGEADTVYSRTLLNAPIVMSRYAGDFKGIVVAEFALWRLNQFTFTFDPVFTRAPLLPFLDFTKILNIQ